MKTLLATFLIFVSTAVSACQTKEQPKPKETETRRVCIMVYDAKEKREVEKCRVIKIYQPHEGTPIPKR